MPPQRRRPGDVDVDVVRGTTATTMMTGLLVAAPLPLPSPPPRLLDGSECQAATRAGVRPVPIPPRAGRRRRDRVPRQRRQVDDIQDDVVSPRGPVFPRAVEGGGAAVASVAAGARGRRRRRRERGREEVAPPPPRR